MDETQRRKLSAKEFIEKNKNIGFIILAIFTALFLVYFSFVFFYGRANTSNNSLNESTLPVQEESFFGSLLPTFSKEELTNSELDNDFLSNFNQSGDKNNSTKGENEEEEDSKIVKIDEKPILGFAVFDKPMSIKNYIKNKPKICAEKLEVVLKKDDKSTAVLTFQNTLKSIEGYEETPTTGILDIETREKIYIFQQRFAEILYKKKQDKSPTRLIDKETVHFLNLLCNLDKEEKDDFVQVPTLRYVLKETREIIDYNTESKEKISIEAKLATGTEEIVLSKNGEFAVFRKEINGTIDSIFYNIRNKSITHLENNITTLDFNDKNILIYGVPGYQGIILKSYDYLANKSSRLANLPLNDWNIFTINNNEIGINSKPTAFADGIYMIFNIDTKKINILAGPLLGMSTQKTSLSDFTILSTGGSGETKTLLLNNKTRNIGDFGIRTFAEKCAQSIFAGGIFCAVPRNLSENFIYPDDWYKGKVRTEDLIVFKTLSGTSSKVISTLDNRPISIINLNVNKNGIFFIDENTLSLYSLEL